MLSRRGPRRPPPVVRRLPHSSGILSPMEESVSKQEPEDSAAKLGRRGFLKVVGGAAVAVPLASAPGFAQDAWSAMQMDMSSEQPATPAPDSGTPLPAGYQFLNANESQFVEAA